MAWTQFGYCLGDLVPAPLRQAEPAQGEIELRFGIARLSCPAPALDLGAYPHFSEYRQDIVRGRWGWPVQTVKLQPQWVQPGAWVHGMQLNDDPAACGGPQCCDKKPKLNGVVSDMVADHDVGGTRLRRSRRPRAVHAAVWYSPLGAGQLEGAKHVLGVVNTSQVGDLRYQGEPGGTRPTPDIEHGPPVWA